MPPLSNLEVVGEPLVITTERGPMNVCQLRVNVNLKGLTIDELQQRRKTLHVSMCDNLMSEAELTAIEEARSAGDARWDELKQAVEAAVEEGRAVMKKQAGWSVEDFNNDSKYSKMLHEAVQVKALPLPVCLVEAGANIDATSINWPLQLLLVVRGGLEALRLALVNAGACSLRRFR